MEFTQLVGFDETVLVLVHPVETEGRAKKLLLADLAVAVLIAWQDEYLCETTSVASAIRSGFICIGCNCRRIRRLTVGMAGLVGRFQFFP